MTRDASMWFMTDTFDQLQLGIQEARADIRVLASRKWSQPVRIKLLLDSVRYELATDLQRLSLFLDGLAL